MRRDFVVALPVMGFLTAVDENPSLPGYSQWTLPRSAFNVQVVRQEKNHLAESMPEKAKEMKRRLLETWGDIIEEGPNERWEAETRKPVKGATLSD